ncbi:MAG: hypothetical protein Q4D65_09480 [Peptostreptococcaceae bacterium]|nr:hypothetical protein [Peptostreptococcaceae bacterium]
MIKNFLVEYRREISEIKKYKFNLLFSNIKLLITFYAVTRFLMAEEREILFFILFCWYFVSKGFLIPSYIMEGEISDKTLLSIVQSKTSVAIVLCTRCLVTLAVDFLKALVFFGLLALVGNFDFSFLSWNIAFSLVSAMLMVIVSSYLVGFFVSLLSMRFKRATSIVSLLSYWILFFSGLTLPAGNNFFTQSVALLLPFQAFRSMMEMMVQGMDHSAFLSLIVTKFLLWSLVSAISLMYLSKQLIKKEYIYHV